MHGFAQETKLPSIWPYLALSALLASCVNFGAGYHTHHNSDSLLPVLVSLCRWTPFFWAGNRVGMLLPALALPFEHPLHNLLVQTGLTLFAAFASTFLLARVALRRPGWPLVGCAGAALLLLVPTPKLLYTLTFQQMHYPVALALGLAALLLLEYANEHRPPWWRIVAALVLLALALWVNIGMAPLFGLLVPARALVQTGSSEPTAFSLLSRLRNLVRRMATRETVLAVVVLVVAYASADLNRRLHPMDNDPVKAGLAKVRTWPTAWGKIAAGMWLTEVQPKLKRYLFPVCLAAALYLIPAVRRGARGPLLVAGALMMVAVPFALLAGASRWAQDSHDWRYWFPSYYLLLGIVALVAVGPLAESCRPRARSLLVWVAVPVLPLLVTWQYGVHSPARVRADLDRMRGGADRALAADLLAADCTHVAGDYWRVVAGAFYANLRLHEQGESRKVWPVSSASCETWDVWGRMPPVKVRVAVPLVGGQPDPEAAAWLGRLSPISIAEMAVVEKRPTCWILRPTDQVVLDQPPSSRRDEMLATWHTGFYAHESSPKGEARWCQRHGKLTLTNPANEPRTVTLKLRLSTRTPARVRIDGPGTLDAEVVDQEGTSYRRTLTLPGRAATTFEFSTDAPRGRSSKTDWRKSHFQVSDFELLERR